MSNWIGYAVSVNCGEPLGCYQGTILETDGTTITLTKAFRNGFPYPKSKVTLNAADIKDLKIIEESHSQPVKQTHSTVAVTKNNKKGQRATVCENLQANPSSLPCTVSNQQNTNILNTAHVTKTASVRGGGTGPTRSKPIDIQGSKNNKNISHSGSSGAAGSTPKGRAPGEKARRRNEACFGDAAEPALLRDFDFEGNLALFDKQVRWRRAARPARVGGRGRVPYCVSSAAQALWEEMRSGAARPDVVRGADEAGARLRHDESVLGARAAERGPAIELPEELRGGVQYRTEAGAAVPAASAALRRRLWAALRGAAAEAARVLLARAAADDVALRLVGGGRRLERRNAHQAPVCVALAGAHRFGAAAVLAARLLHSHGARAHVLVAGSEEAVAACGELQRELSALAESGVGVGPAPPSPDLVLVALHDPEGGAGGGGGGGRAGVGARRPGRAAGAGAAGRRLGGRERARQRGGAAAGRAGAVAGPRVPGQRGAAAAPVPRPALPLALRRRQPAAAAPRRARRARPARLTFARAL
ncbi:unnamed protein product, partial [Iphiclides podalirius]